ncbi:hypothetical protein ACFE04_018574 [Oxalis oulophora]
MDGPFNSNSNSNNPRTLLCFILFYMHVSVFATNHNHNNPFTTTAFLNRYWNKHITNNYTKPQFLFSKASSLTLIDSAKLAKSLVNPNFTINDSFCSLAKLYCPVESLRQSNISKLDANFAHYTNKNFANYGTSKLSGLDSFKNYSDGINTPNESFKTYSKSANGHSEGFASYGKDANVAVDNFTSYGTSSTGGSGEFNNYEDRTNVPNLKFISYNSDTKAHKLRFTTYSDDTNSGSEGFISYSKNGKSAKNEFVQYAENANIIGSNFNGYSESGNKGNDSFKAYGDSGNNPHNNFKNYGSGGVSESENFVNYRDKANVGVDSFQSYARNSSYGKVGFVNYGNTFNLGNSSFKDYGKGSKGANTAIDFKSYNLDRSFIGYIQKGVTFASYNNVTSNNVGSSRSEVSLNKWVEPGKFFREAMLREGNVMIMPDIMDKMPKRTFLPRTISSKLPFSTLGLSTMKRIFHASDNSPTERMLVNAATECERAPSRGETKSCVGSIEDMIDFATSVLGRNVVARTTENVGGSKQEIMIGRVKGINRGQLTKSVSCHQSLYPYLLYYCHSVPKVKVYEADILDVKSKTIINHGVAICHIDTSAWSPSHAAFVSLGSSPGKIEVCHWIFENDMSWSVNDI